jgi:hypothetical protein
MAEPVKRAGYWNIWWTLTVISAALTVAVVVLEVLGFFRDLGIILSAIGTAVTLLFGLTASTRSSVRELRGEIVPRLDEIIRLLDERLPRP